VGCFPSTVYIARTCIHIYTTCRGVESSSISTSVSLVVIKDFSTNYMTALGLNQAYTSLRLRNIYHIVLNFNMFIYFDNGKYITARNKKLIRFFFSSITRMIFD